jgi:hypothetical protein
VALGQVFLRVLRFSPVNIIPPSFSILIYHPNRVFPVVSFMLVIHIFKSEYLIPPKWATSNLQEPDLPRTQEGSVRTFELRMYDTRANWRRIGQHYIFNFKPALMDSEFLWFPTVFLFS